jgi:hypothetical protein
LTLQVAVKENEEKGRRAIQTFGSPHAEQNKSLCSGSWAKLGQWLEDGSIKVSRVLGRVRPPLTYLVVQPNRYEVLPDGLEGITKGLERMKRGEVSGTKLVAHPQDTK